MSIAGTAFGMLLIVYGAGCNGLLAEMEAIVFDKTTPAQYQLNLPRMQMLMKLRNLPVRLMVNLL